MGKPIMMDSEVLRYLVREHLALQAEVAIAAKAAIIACEHCAHHALNFEECASAHGDCEVCKVRGECPCSGCGGQSKNFEWRGVVEANEPEDGEVEEFMTQLAGGRSAEEIIAHLTEGAKE